MEILQICPNNFSEERGGLYVIEKSLREILNSKTVDTVLLNYSVYSEADYHIQQIKFLNFANYGIPIINYDLISKLIKLDVHLIIIHGIFQFHALLGYFLSKVKKTPYIIFLHGTLDPYVFSYRSTPKYLWMHLIGKNLIQQASAVICTTTREAEKAKQYLHNANVELCPLGVEVPDLSKIENSKYEIRKKLKIPKDQKILLFLGRIHPMKRPIETALAFKEKQPKNWVYLIVGNQEKLDKYSLKSVVDNKIIYYHPPVYGLDKWKILASADAFVHLSYRENFGYSVVEAAAVGLPLLISDGVDIYPLLQEAGAADVITINSIKNIHEGLDNFLEKSEDIHREMGAMAKKVFQENFSQFAFKERLVNLAQKYTKMKH